MAEQREEESLRRDGGFYRKRLSRGRFRDVRSFDADGQAVSDQKAVFKKAEAKRGTSLVIVICVAAFLMAFALAMLYTAGLLLARANRQLEQERCYQLAKSFSEVLDEELTRYTCPVGAAADPSAPAGSQAPDDQCFYSYVRKFLNGVYGEYDPDHPDETIFHYTGAGMDADTKRNYGNVRVVLYKEANPDAAAMSGDVPDVTNPESVIDADIYLYDFTVEVTAESEDGKLSCRYSTEYRQSEIYEVAFTTTGGIRVYWDETNGIWHEGSESGIEYDPLTHPAETIRYQYSKDNVKQCIFKNIYEKAGGSTP